MTDKYNIDYSDFIDDKSEFKSLNQNKLIGKTGNQVISYFSRKDKQIPWKEKLVKGLTAKLKGTKRDPDIAAKAAKAKIGVKHNISEESKRKRTNKTSTPVNCYNLQGQLITTYESQSEACRQLGLLKNDGTPSVDKIAKGLSHKQKAKGYYWRYAPYKDNIKDEIDALTGNKMKGQTRARAILQFDLEGNLVNEWSNAKVAGEQLGISNSNINNVCIKNSKGKFATYKGFVWQYLSA
jgi:hypothetical protein